MAKPGQPQDDMLAVLHQQGVMANVHVNIRQEGIVITEDKMRLILREHLEKAEAKGKWIGPFSVAVSIIVTLTTSTFRDALGFKAAGWEAVYAIGFLGSLWWTCATLYKARGAMTIDDVIAKMKAASPSGAVSAGASQPQPPPAPPTT